MGHEADPSSGEIDVNWDTATHEWLYGKLSVAQAEGLGTAHQTWTGEVAAHCQKAADLISNGMREIGASWQGMAADGAKGSAAPLATHAVGARDAATAIAQGVQAQQQMAVDTSHRIEKPPPKTTAPNVVNPTGRSTDVLATPDMQAQAAAAREAEQRARELGKTYWNGVTQASSGMPQYADTPVVTVDVSAQPPRTGDVGYSSPGVTTPTGSSTTGSRSSSTPTGGSVAPTPTVNPTTGTPPPPGGVPGSAVSPVPGVGGAGTTTPEGLSPNPVGTPPSQVVNPVQGGVPVGGGDQPRTGLGLLPTGPYGSGNSDGRGPAGSGGRGALGTPGAEPGKGGVRGGPGVGAGVPGTAATEGHAAGRSGVAGRGGAGPVGGMPVGAGAGRSGEDDTEHEMPSFLKRRDDDLWDDNPPVAPAVIGEDDE
ncbi:hypothetical protein EV193_11622 [Herbihabitans rhizosphaerae]|uniref:PPE family protein n=1 Tax=Herbihabitans rhizosphaerae TaxID=1872711 RepID=A0A4V2ERD8_9PSEU|nr:hypothetical protein [Herbihabitans rhizosphaerae]RZS30502.1 hypothetical protein EV193_11622 [Herbihabitans rhizosphaerae]